MKVISLRGAKILFAGVPFISPEKSIFAPRGFTLIETIIYIALFGVLIGGAVASAYQVLEGGGRNQILIEVQQEGTFINRKINWEATNAETAEASLSSLILEPGHVVFAEVEGRMTISRGVGGTRLPISSEAFVISNTAFVVTSGAGGKPTSVHATFKVGDVPFVFSRYLRN